MTDRSRFAALAKIVGACEPGGFTLPDPVVAAFADYAATAALTVPDAPGLQHPDDAAVQLADAVRDRGEVDPLALARLSARNRAEARDVADARGLIGGAVEVAAARAVSATAAAADLIVCDHLRPRFVALLDEARAAAAVLGGQRVDDARAMLTAPAKVRAAAAAAHGLADRLDLLRLTRSWVNRVTEDSPVHDTAGLFADYETPMALWPGWTPQQQPQPIPAPADATERMLWLVTAGSAATPWLPTVAERDARWWAVFGEGQQERQVADLAARAYAGMPV